MSLLLTDNASPGSSDGMMLGFLVKEGRGMEKLVIVAISLNLLTESLHKHHRQTDRETDTCIIAFHAKKGMR